MAELQTYQKITPLSSDSMEILRHFIKVKNQAPQRDT